MNLKPKTIAQAFWETIQDRSYAEITTILSGLQAFSRLVEATRDVRDFLNHPAIAFAKKTEFIQEFLALMDAPQESSQFLSFLLKDRHLGDLHAILVALHQVRNDHFHVASAKVASCAPLTDDQKKSLESQLKTTFNASYVELSGTLDSTLLGGLILHINGQVWDVSLKGKLEKLKCALSS